MVTRGVFISVPKNIDNTFKFCTWLYAELHRYYFPYYLFLVLGGGFIFLYTQETSSILIALILVESFYFSMALHEAFHFSVAYFLEIETIFISIVPHKLQLRIHFSKRKNIPAEDLAIILLAGSYLSLLFFIIIFIVRFFLSRWVEGNLIYLILITMSIINLLSLLPMKDSDGGRAYILLKKNLKRTMLFYIYYFSVKLGFISKKNS